MDATLEVLRKDGDRRRNRKWHDVVKARIAAIALPDMTLCSAHRELDRLTLEFLAKLSWRGEGLRTMKASKFTEAQKAFILKQRTEGTPVAEICRQADDFRAAVKALERSGLVMLRRDGAALPTSSGYFL